MGKQADCLGGFSCPQRCEDHNHSRTKITVVRAGQPLSTPFYEPLTAANYITGGNLSCYSFSLKDILIRHKPGFVLFFSGS